MFIGITNAVIMILPTSILADIIDHDEVSRGERRSGAYVAIDNLVYKLGLALGVGLGFGLLALVHFDPSARQHSVADVHNIRMLGFGLPGLLLLPAIGLLLRHPITKAVQRRLRNQIEARHGAISPGIEAPAVCNI
jgi:Na+/melibiose symporter-like transporter